MSRLLYQAELLRRDGRPARREAAPGRSVQSPLTESNRRPSPYHGDALPTELRGREPDEDTRPRGARGQLDRRALAPVTRTAPDRWPVGRSTRVAGEGFEPSKASPTDLQSAPIGRSGNLPGVPRGDPERIARAARRRPTTRRRWHRVRRPSPLVGPPVVGVGLASARRSPRPARPATPMVTSSDRRRRHRPSKSSPEATSSRCPTATARNTSPATSENRSRS